MRRLGDEDFLVTCTGSRASKLDTPVMLSIQVGLARQMGSPGAPDRMDRPWKRGFLKAPIAGPTRLGWTNLDGDGQANL